MEKFESGLEEETEEERGNVQIYGLDLLDFCIGYIYFEINTANTSDGVFAKMNTNKYLRTWEVPQQNPVQPLSVEEILEKLSH